MKTFKDMKKNLLRVSFLILILISVLALINFAAAEPGDDGDPVVSLSYIQNKVIPELKAYVDSKLSEGKADDTSSESAVFEVVNIGSGQSLIGAKGTEIILRMGKAEIIAAEKGGLADTTAGYDLGSGEDMPSNHLLIVPLADGRGLKAKTDIIVMVKGGYTIR